MLRANVLSAILRLRLYKNVIACYIDTISER